MRGGAGGRRRPGHDRPRRIARRRELQRLRRPPGQHRRHQLGDRRHPDRFHVRLADRDIVQLQHLPRRVVDELQPRLGIDDDDAFDHAGEDRFHARAIARLLRQTPPDILHRRVQRTRHGAELIVAEAELRRRQVAALIAVRDARDEPHALTDARGKEPRDRGTAQERKTERRERRRENRLELMPHAGQRQRDPDEADRGVADGRRDVQHVDLQRRAVAFRAAESGGAGLHHFRPLPVVLHGGQALERFGRIARDAAVRRDERDARPNQAADAIRLLLQFCRRGQRGRTGEQVRRQARFGHQRRFDSLVGLPAHRRREQQAGNGERDDGGGERREEELGLKRGADGRHEPTVPDRRACSRTA